MSWTRSVGLGWLVGAWIVAVLLTTAIGDLQERLVTSGVLILSVSHVLADPAEGTGDRNVSVYAAALGCWWVLTWLRSISAGIPLFQAFSFGRDFLFFALALVALPSFVARHRSCLRHAASVMAVAAILYVGVQVAASTGLVDVSHLLQALYLKNSKQSNGPVRIFSAMNYLVALGLAVSVAAVWQARKLWHRLLGWLCTAVFATGVLLQETRAAYFGLVAGLILGVLLWRAPASAEWTATRGRVLRSLVVLGGIVVVLVAVEPAVVSIFWQRATSAIGSISRPTGDGGVRLQAYRQMLSVLGARWPIGLGFLDPLTRNFVTLPSGSIRDSDLGVMNSFMTMGAIGTVLLYAPVLRAIRKVLPAHRPEGGENWWRLGCLIWLLSVLFSSPTLVVLFSVPGVALVAAVVAAVTAAPAAVTAAPAAVIGAPAAELDGSRRRGDDRVLHRVEMPFARPR